MNILFTSFTIWECYLEIYNHNQASNTQENVHSRPEDSQGLPSGVNDALDIIAHTNEPLAQRSHKTGWKFLQQVFDSHYIHNKAFNAERDYTVVSDKDDDDIDFKRDDHQGFLQTAKQRIASARQRMSPEEFRQTMRLNPVERFKRIQSSSDDESQNYTGFDSHTIRNSATTAEASNNSIHNNQDKIEQTKSSLAPKQNHIQAPSNPLNYNNNKNASDTKNTDDNIIQPPSATPPP